MGQIMSLVKDLKDQIIMTNYQNKNTLEIIGPELKLDVHQCEVGRELAEVKAYYGDRFYSRRAQEDNHYNQLKYSLIHKLEETAFFFKEGSESRKNIIFSNDCISCIQYIEREDTGYMYVHMRSSDVVDLLPLDLYALYKLMLTISGNVKERKLRVTIGSAHLYLYDSPRVD